MKKRGGWFLLLLIVIAIAVVFLAPSYGWKLRAWLGPSATAQPDTPSLAAENEALKARLAVLQDVASQLPQASSSYLRAIVYSRYPFNFKNELLVNAGADQNVAAGKAAVFQGIFIGTVGTVFPDTALIETVFDSNFKMPVRVGQKGYDALFVGGASPLLTSLKKDAPVAAGDIVYTAAAGFPYGLPVAVIRSTSTSPTRCSRMRRLILPTTWTASSRSLLRDDPYVHRWPRYPLDRARAAILVRSGGDLP